MKQKGQSIFKRLFIPLFAIMILQAGIFYLFTAHGGIIEIINKNAEDILEERVTNRRNELESMFLSKWGNLDSYSESLNAIYDAVQVDGAEPMYNNLDMQKMFLKDSKDVLIRLIRTNQVSGAFVILNNANSSSDLKNSQNVYGLDIRDYDVSSSYSNTEDLQVLRSPTSIIEYINCSLDSYWESSFHFDSNDPGNFYYKPLEIAYENPEVNPVDLAYFDGKHVLGSEAKKVVSFSIPLIADDGTIYGVLGIELTTDLLTSFLPSEEIDGTNKGGYLLVQYDKGEMDNFINASSGVLANRVFGDDDIFTRTQGTIETNGNMYTYTGRGSEAIVCYNSPISIYNRNTPYDTEVLSVVGFTTKKDFYSVSSDIKTSLLWMSLLVLVIGVIGIFFVSHMISKPIIKLAKEVSDADTSVDTTLKHTDIEEIDQLVNAIETQSRKISQSQVRTEFFSRMSHDLRTPMNAIIGFSSKEVLENSSESDKLEFLSKINSSGNYMLGLVNEVLDMTKIDSGRMELNIQPFEFQSIWDNLNFMMDELASQKSIHFIKEIPNDHRYMLGDSQRISQIVVNLLSNAIKFTPKNGTVSLLVRETKKSDDTILLNIVVKDTGQGMSEEFQEKLYQPFTQEHSNREGTGLGLSIAYQLVKIMKGSIHCDSVLSEGTTFTVRIPLQITKQLENSNSGDALSQDSLSTILNGKRVLLCEDHPMNRQIATRVLENMKMVVDSAENGQIGVDMFAQSSLHYYDVILMDIRMPIKNGYEATKEIRSLNREDAKSVPIIAMTANAFKEDIENSRIAGMNEHLSKPIDPQKLYQTLAKFVTMK